MNPRFLSLAVLSLLLPGLALAQVFVVPRRPPKTMVRAYEFDWRHVDIMVGPSAEKGPAPLPTRRIRPPQAPPPSTAPQAPPPSSAPQGSVEHIHPPAPGEPRLRSPWVPLPARETLALRTTALEVDPPAPAATIPREAPDGGVAVADAGVGDAGPADRGALTAIPQADGGTPVAAADGGTQPTDGGYATSLGARSGGVRFFFYESERHVAELAVPQLEAAYRYLVERFKYVPAETFPYYLYSSYQEFLQTNLFPLSEGTLGVTSTQNLDLTLPYLGDHQLFAEVSTHELVHQFTIQKVRSVAQEAKAFGNPLQGLPLWFIEGLAEYYAKDGLDPEAEMMVRDLMVNPDVLRGYAFVDFFQQGPYGFLFIYKLGQARVAFLEETYGEGFVQKVLENSPKLVGAGPQQQQQQQPQQGGMTFETLLEELTGDEPRTIASRFEAWMKRRAYTAWLKSEQSNPTLEPLREREGIVTALNSSPDGQLLMYRSIMPETGETRLVLADSRAPTETVRVASDGMPGMESLHPIFGRNFALTGDRLAFIAEADGYDLIYVQEYKHSAEKMGAGEVTLRNPNIPAPVQPPSRKPRYRVRISLGERKAYALQRHGVVAAYAPAFSPDGKQLAFIGLDEKGTRDVYVMNLEAGPGAALTRLTEDVYTERQLTWGPSGIIFSSDATSHGHYNLFRVKPEAPRQVQRLTTDARDHQDPVVLPNGRIFFSAYESSRADLHEYTGSGVVRRTDMTTGLFEPCPGPDGGVWALFHQSGQRVPSLLKTQRMLNPPEQPIAAGEPADPLVQNTLGEARKYDPLDWKNIDIGPVFGYAGAGGGGFFGQVFATAADRLKDHRMLLSVAAYGSFELMDGYLLYLNNARRTTWGGGLFQSLRFRVDSFFDQYPEVGVVSTGERFFGALGTLRYPLNTFLYLQGELALGGTTYFVDPFTGYYLYIPELNGVGDLYTPWRASIQGTRFQTEARAQLGYNALRYHYLVGPIAGTALLTELDMGMQPLNGEVFGNLRADAEHYIPLFGTTRLLLRGGAGSTFGGRFARSFFLSSFDTIRSIRFGDVQWLLGRHYLYSTLELKVPLNELIRVAFLSNLEGVAGFDAGGVGPTLEGIWERRVLNAAVGANFTLGPVLLRLHFAYPFDIGAPAGRPARDWVTQFSLGLIGLDGFFTRQSNAQQRPRHNPFVGSPGALGW